MKNHKIIIEEDYIYAVYFKTFDVLYFKFTNSLDSPGNLMKAQLEVYDLQKRYQCLRLFQDASYEQVSVDEATLNLLTKKYDEFFTFLPNTRNCPYEGKSFIKEKWEEVNKLVSKNSKTEFNVCGDLTEAIEFMFNKENKKIDSFEELLKELRLLVKD